MDKWIRKESHLVCKAGPKEAVRRLWAGSDNMEPFQKAWSLLKALPEQQMGYDDEGMQWNRTMHPAIQGMVARAGEAGRTPSPYDFSAVGGDSDAYIQNLPGHPAEFRNNPKEEGESFRREPHQYPKEGQRVASPEEMKRVDSKNLESLFMEDGDEDYTELLPETYKERNARIWQEHQARENAPFVEPAPRYGRGGSGKEYKSIGEYPYDPAETAFTALKDIQQAKHPLGDD